LVILGAAQLDRFGNIFVTAHKAEPL